MKRRRTMLLCVTATSMAAAIGCGGSTHPVGMVGQPRDPGERTTEAGASPDTSATTTAPEPRVGTTAQSPEELAPSVGTTAKVPEQRKTADAGAQRLPDEVTMPRVGTTATAPD